MSAALPASAPASLEQRLLAAMGRFAGAVLLALLALLSLSLVTWSVSDPSLTHATSGEPRNLMGALGAILSDLMLQTFGLGSLVVLAVPLFWALAMVGGEFRPVGGPHHRLIFYPVAAFVLAGALSALPVPSSWPLHHGLGGILGDTVFAMTAQLFGIINEARGGLAAGFVLSLGGAMALQRALALTRADLLAALSGATETPRATAEAPASEPPSSATASTSTTTAEQPAPRIYVDQSGRIEPSLAVHGSPFVIAPVSASLAAEARVHRPAPVQAYADPPVSHGAPQAASTSPAADAAAQPTGLALAIGVAEGLARAHDKARRASRMIGDHARRLKAGVRQHRADQAAIAAAADPAAEGMAGTPAAALERSAHQLAHAASAVRDVREPLNAPQRSTPRAYVPPHPPVYDFHPPLRGPAAINPPTGHQLHHDHDPHFDIATDAASREIARRFAPPGAVPLNEPPHFDEADYVADADATAADHAPVVITPAELPRRAGEPHAASSGVAAPAPAPASSPSAAVRPSPPAAAHGIHNAMKGRSAAARAPSAAPAAAIAPQASDVAPHAGRRNAILGGLAFRSQTPPALRPPPLTLLQKATPAAASHDLTETVLRGSARLLEDVLADFGIKAEVRDIRPGPVVTLYEIEPARGTKSSRVIALADDIARSMSATACRVAVVPGRNAIGIELPNAQRDKVLLREILESDAFRAPDAALPVALGKSIGGEPIIADLARMPHLLVAGTTGSGKSVGVNAMILSLLARLGPDDCRFLMIDPKMLELSVYNGIPHLLAPVVTDPQQAVTALAWVVAEMEERYKRMAKLSVRSIDVFNNRVRNAKKRGEMIQRTVQTGFDHRTGTPVYEHEHLGLETMPYIVVVIDELADLMLTAGKEVEGSVQRLAQMARAAGIHLVMATQRPSVDVITGTIKANFPTRISFKVASKIDSRTILGEQGAEQLLGAGDMLFASGSGVVTRIHGAFVADEEVEAVANYLRAQGPPNYVDALTVVPAATADGAQDKPRGEGEEDLYDRAVAIVLRDQKASTSYLQRRLSIGYNRAADLIERMESDGVVGPANAVGKREILASVGGSRAPESAARSTSSADAA